MLNQSGFDHWAGSYDVSIGSDPTGYPFEGYYQVLEFVWQQLGESVRNQRVLDLGIGTGLLSRRLYDEGTAIVGLDFSAKMLRLAKEKMPSGEFIRHDLSEPLPARIIAGKYDYIISSYAVHHLSAARLIALIRESLLLLRADGKLVFADVGFLNESDRNSCQEKYKSIWDNSENYLVAEKLLGQLHSCGYELAADYTQVSTCAGVLVVAPTQ